MQSAKETASNIAATAKSGLEKTKATVQEKAEKLTTTDPVQKEMATQKKEEKIHQAERMKQETRQHNAANKQAAAVTGGQPTDYSTGGDFSTERVLGTGTATGGAARAGLPTQNPTGTATGGTARVGPQDPNVAGGASTGYGSGNTY